MLKLTQIDNSVGVVLPKEVLSRLKLDKGERVFLTKTPATSQKTPLPTGLRLHAHKKLVKQASIPTNTSASSYQ